MREKELETADAKAAADAVREEIAREEQSAAPQLEKKLAELSVLQAEVDRLRRETKSGPQVLVKVKVIDVDVTKLREVGFDFRTPDDGQKQPEDLPNLVEQMKGNADGTALRRFVLSKGQKTPLALFERLEQQELASVVCEPNLVGRSERPAGVMLFGGQFPVPNGPDMRSMTMKSYGTKIDFTPQLQADGRLQMDLMVSLSSLDMKHAVTLVDGTKVPALHVSEMNACFECNAGDTLDHGRAERGADHRRSVLSRAKRSAPTVNTCFVASCWSLRNWSTRWISCHAGSAHGRNAGAAKPVVWGRLPCFVWEGWDSDHAPSKGGGF